MDLVWLNAEGVVCKLQDGRTLADYGIPKEAMLRTLLRMRQGVPSEKWRPRLHADFPPQMRSALRSLLLLAKATA